MKCDRAVGLKLASLRLQERYPEEFLPLIRQDLTEMFILGLEEGHREARDFGFAQHSTAKQIGQYDLEGNLVNHFKSLREACKITGYSKTGIQHSMNHNVPTRGKWVWKYINKESPSSCENGLTK